MFVFSNTFFFPLLQGALLVVFLFALFVDAPWQRAPNLKVTRADESMNWIERATGIAGAVLLTILDKSVFDADPAIGHYAAFFVFADVVAVAYVCFFSAWGRNKLVWIYNRRRDERR